MAKLTKNQARMHQQACELLAADRDLSEDEKEFVLEHWQEAAHTTHALAGAFFTPLGLARDLSIEVSGDRIIDLGAGIGHLAWSCRDLCRRANNEPVRELVCVEANPTYVAVGRRLLPEATWICADLLDVPGMGLGRFDTAIANPPFGAIARAANSPGGYRGRRFEYHVIAVAAQLARWGAFIIPQQSAPFRYSGEPYFREQRDPECDRFEQATGITLEPSCGIETSIYAEDWHNVRPRVEVVTCDFAEPAAAKSPTFTGEPRQLPPVPVGEQLELLPT